MNLRKVSEINSISNPRLRRAIPLLLGTIVALSLFLTAIPVASASLGSWSATTTYPTGIHEQSCVVSLGFVYCIGGLTSGGSPTSAVYFALLSPSGIGPWSATTNYPTGIHFQSCVVNSGFVYCIGGLTPSGNPTSAIYFALLSPGGVGPWLATTNYPINIAFQSCVVDSSFVYCVGGAGYTNAVYFALLSPSGVGPWSATTNYPTIIAFQSCVGSSGFVYCIGGNLNVITAAVYFAPLSSSGVGLWLPTTSYPMNIVGQSCVVDSGSVYCVGGKLGFTGVTGATNAVDFAALSPVGVGNWASTTSYPTIIYDLSCVVSSSYIYCIGGDDGTSAVYFASSSSTTSTSINCSLSSVAVNQPTMCTAAVTDTSPIPTSPTGTVTFSSSASSSFTPSNPCTLSPTSSSTSSCSVSYTPSPGTEGSQTITAAYGGDLTHQGSSGTTSLQVTQRTTSTSVSCSAAFLTDHHATPCTATVTDTSPGTPIAPSGTVSWRSSGKGTFSPNPCTLSGAGATATCIVTYTASPGKPLPQTITGTYGGDADHFGSKGTTPITTP